MPDTKLEDDKHFLHLKDLETKGSKKYWDEGDYILQNQLSNADLRRYSTGLGLKTNTLRKRADVAREFPELGGLRDYSRPFGVYEKLLPIPTDEGREQLLREKPICTVDDMQKRVAAWLKEHDPKGSRGPRDKKSQGMRIGAAGDPDAVYIHADRRGDNLDIYVEHESVRYVRHLEADGKLSIVAKLS